MNRIWLDLAFIAFSGLALYLLEQRERENDALHMERVEDKLRIQQLEEDVEFWQVKALHPSQNEYAVGDETGEGEQHEMDISRGYIFETYGYRNEDGDEMSRVVMGLN